MAQGTSAKHAEMTPVVLKSTLPHETQKQLQNSLQMTPRLPIEDEPSECMQEAADSVMTAGHTNGMAETAKPIITDIDRTAMLGKDLAMVACGVDKGDNPEHNKLQLQQTNLFCEKPVSTTETQQKTYLAYMECHSRGSGQDVQAVKLAAVEVLSSKLVLTRQKHSSQWTPRMSRTHS